MMFRTTEAPFILKALCIFGFLSSAVSLEAITYGYKSYQGRKQISEKVAFQAGEDVVKYGIQLCVSLGQGNFFKDLKESLKKGKELKPLIDSMRYVNPHMRTAFAKGFAHQLGKENVDEFIVKARFTEGQGKIVKKIWNFCIEQVIALDANSCGDWEAFTKQHQQKYELFFAEILSAAANEFDF